MRAYLLAVLLALTGFAADVRAQVYVSTQPDGSRMIRNVPPYSATAEEVVYKGYTWTPEEHAAITKTKAALAKEKADEQVRRAFAAKVAAAKVGAGGPSLLTEEAQPKRSWQDERERGQAGLNQLLKDTDRAVKDWAKVIPIK